MAVFWETVVPSFLIDPTVFWHHFEGPGLPESSKIEKKTFMEMSVFFSREKYSRDLFFEISGHILESVLEPRPAKKVSDRVFFFGFFEEGAILNLGSLFLSKTMCFTRVFFRI